MVSGAMQKEGSKFFGKIDPVDDIQTLPESPTALQGQFPATYASTYRDRHMPVPCSFSEMDIMRLTSQIKCRGHPGQQHSLATLAHAVDSRGVGREFIERLKSFAEDAAVEGGNSDSEAAESHVSFSVTDE